MAKTLPPVVNGTFDVQGKSHVIVRLPWRPASVVVDFGDQDPFVDLPSCDLSVGDELSFTLIKEVRRVSLQISWNVKGTRTVVWVAKRS